MGGEALLIGLLSGVVPPAGRADWLERLRGHPLASIQSHAVADAVEVENDPSEKPRLVKGMIERVYGRSPDERLLVARWLLQLAPAIERGGDAVALREFLEFAAGSGPLGTYAMLQNDLAYLDLVLGGPVDHADIDRRALNFPENAACRFTQALSQWRRGQAAKALVTVDSTGLRARDLLPPQQVVLACVLAANGQPEKAARIRAMLEVSGITRQERALLEESMR